MAHIIFIKKDHLLIFRSMPVLVPNPSGINRAHEKNEAPGYRNLIRGWITHKEVAADFLLIPVRHPVW